MTAEVLFEAALSRPPQERAAFLDAACAGNLELRAAVDALLAGHAPAQASPPTRDFQPTTEAGAVIAGRYTLVEKIGEGGMGEVWVAKQTEPVKRKVALKLIKAGMDSRAVLQRFEQERQALALMDHAHIARVLDGGLTADRRPFFAMALVNGLPLIQFCDDARLGVRQRLELFVPICQAVQHAHQKGIVHRDLKPSNILVTIVDGKPVPKVIDFGVAKAIAGRLTEESLSTQFGMVVGTLEYMSPEQAGFAGADVDTRADIYSLGVILYELLTGLRPIDAGRLKQAALTELMRILKEEEPSRPSARLSTDAAAPSLAALRQTEPRKLTALLRGELDWVVMKCLEKQRDRRYETANGLARDIERFLADEPVEARPPSAGYRLRKFVGRHRGQVVAAALVLAALVAGMAGTGWGLVRARQANAELAAEQAKVQARFELAQQAIATFHTGVSEDALLKNEEFKELRTRLLKQAAGFYADLDKLLAGQEDAKSRQLLAAGYYQLGELTEKIGDQREALAVHRKALALRRELAAEPGADGETRLDVARSLEAVGKLVAQSGDTSAALAAYEEQRDIAATVVAEAPSTASEMMLARGHHNIGHVIWLTSKPAEALAAQQQALAILQKLAAANPSAIEVQHMLADNYGFLGAIHFSMDRPAEAVAAHQQARVIYQQLADANPANTSLQRELAESHRMVGVQWQCLCKAAEAQACYEQSLAIYQRLVYHHRAVTAFQDGLALAYLTIGMLRADYGPPADGLPRYQQALTIYQKLAAANPAVDHYRAGIACAHDSIGRALTQMGKPDEAVAAHQQALAIYRKLAAANRAITNRRLVAAYTQRDIGVALERAGKSAEAMAAYREVLAIYQELLGVRLGYPQYARYVAIVNNDVGRLHARQRRFAEAFAALDQGLALRQKLLDEHPANPPDLYYLADSHATRGWAHVRAGHPAEAAADLRRALALWDKLPTLDVDNRFTRSRTLALLAALGKDTKSGVTPAEAKAFADQAVAALQDAVTAGWARPAELREPDFDAMRGRAEFQRLVAELEKKS